MGYLSEISAVKSASFLDKSLDSRLDWSVHIDGLAGTLAGYANTKANTLRVLAQNIGTHAFLLVYHADIHSRIRYGIIFWGNVSQIEQYDSVPSVCFNCSIDVCNFYFFKLHCVQNEAELKDLQISSCKTKKLKLHCCELKDIQSPDIKTTESVLNWLSSKRVNLAEISPAKLTVDSVTQTHQSQCDSSSQTDLAEMVSKESQTINFQKCDISTQSDMIKTVSKMCQTVDCKTIEAPSNEYKAVKSKLTEPKNENNDDKTSVIPKRKTRSSSGTSTSNAKNITDCSKNIKLNSLSSPKKSKRTKSIQTIISNEEKSIQTEKNENVHECYCQTDSCKVVDSFSQTDSFKVIDGFSQTDSCKVIDSFSQTERSKLMIKVFHTSIVPEINTQDSCIQTEAYNLVDQYAQCDLLNVNHYKNSILPIKGKNSARCKEAKNNYKITDSQTFTDALLNGFDNIFVSKTTQTEVSIHCEHCILSNSFIGKNLLTKDITSKLSIKIPFPEKVKEEKISPVESLQISCTQSPDKFPVMSPQSLGLLQVNSSKSDFVKICKLCDQTLYNKKEIMMHNKTHMQCTICKRKFRSLKATQSHMNDCKVKQTIFSPSVSLVRIEQISGMRETHSEAFEQLSA